MNLRKSFLGIGYFTIVVGTVAVVACSNGGGSGFGGTGDDSGGSSGASSGGSGSGSGGSFGDGGASSDALMMLGPGDFENDPFPLTCEPDGAVIQGDASVYGSVDCPSDKNRQGCPCPKAGTMAACWSGTRAERGIGQCKDGMTTCIMNGETNLVWGPCMGEVLPDPNADAGAAACKCFSTGQWAIANVEPCIFFTDQSMTMATGSVSTTNTMPPACPAMMVHQGDWSTDTIKADCAGEFTLCYTIKAGDPMNPKASDCTVGSACATGWVPAPNAVTPFPNLPGWENSDAACATQFATTGGYGEMSVYGFSADCETIGSKGSPYVFNHEPYCPIKNPPPNCQSGGSGNF
jgi:hypothetical protein